MLDKNFIPDFIENWEAGKKGDEWSSRLNHCQHFLKGWAGSRFDQLPKQIKALRDQKMALLNQQDDAANMRQVEKIENKLEALLEMEESHWKSRSKLHWLANGDRNSKMFHVFASERRRRNLIKGLEDTEGNWRTTEGEMATIIQEYFSELFQSSQPELSRIVAATSLIKSSISKETYELLAKPFNAKEVEDVVKSIHP